MRQKTSPYVRGLFATTVLLALVPPAAAQFGRPSSDDDNGFSSVHLPTNRATERGLIVAREQIENGDYDDSVRYLGEILSSGEDSFLKQGSSEGERTGIKAEARKILGNLPSKGRDAYELWYGARAKKLASEAVATGDIAKLTEVSRRFFHTEAGYQSTMLLGKHHLDHGRPIAAALAFQQLLDAPVAKQKLEPTLSVLAATSWYQAGEKDQAKKLLQSLSVSHPDLALTVAGKESPVRQSNTVFERVEQTASQIENSLTYANENWTIYRGSPSRTGISQGGSPLLDRRWSSRVANLPAVGRVVSELQKSFRQQGVVALPSLQPLAVGDVIFMRSSRELKAIDLESGRILWDLRVDGNDEFSELINTNSSNSANRNAQVVPQLYQAVENRMWNDLVYGTLASDGQRVFAIEDLSPLSNPYMQRMFFAGGVNPGQNTPKTYNKLTALDIKTQGKLVWSVGGPDSDEEALIDAFFLGSPMPLGGNLYALAEIKSGVRLVVLDAETGKLQWSQQLADLERSILFDQVRRLAGASPSYSDGVLVCPISSGVVIAIDLTTRSLLWAYQYPQNTNTYRNGMIIMNRMPNNQKRTNDRWLDSTVTISDSRVLLTPPESSKMYCLNLIDGSLLWSQDRDENLFVACIHQDHAIIVGKQEVSALRMKDGKPAWPAKAQIPSGGMPSGRGYYSDDFYYLPVATGSSKGGVFKINLQTGKGDKLFLNKDGFIPGNLICHKGQIISHSADRLCAYHQAEALKNRVVKGLNKNPRDATALMFLGQLELDEVKRISGKPNLKILKSAIEHLELSHSIQDDGLTRELLTKSLLQALRLDFKGYRNRIPMLEKLSAGIPEHQASLLRVKATGLRESGERMEAFATYMQLFSSAHSSGEGLERLEPELLLRGDRWLQAQLGILRSSASEQEREQMDAVVEQHLQKIDKMPTAASLKRILNLFGNHVQVDHLRLQLAKLTLKEGKLLRCQLELNRLLDSSNEEVRRPAIALMASLLEKSKKYDAAASFYQQLENDFPNEVCLDGKTGTQIVAAIPDSSPVKKHLQAETSWPWGEVTAKLATNRSQTGQRIDRWYPVHLDGKAGPFFSDKDVILDQRLQLHVRDANGKIRFSAPLRGQNGTNYSVNHNVNHAAVYGHLMVISTGNRLIAFDTLNPNSNNSVLWMKATDEGIANLSGRSIVQAVRVNKPGSFPTYRAQDGASRRIGSFGPVLPQGIVYQKYDRLICVDPLDGETLWERQGVPRGCQLFGDEEILIAVPDNFDKAMVYRTIDGTLLGTRAIPKSTERVTQLGRTVLQYGLHGGQMRLRLFDVWENEDVWSASFAPGSHIWLVRDEAVGVMQPDGLFQLFALEDGRKIVDQKLVPEPQLSGILILPSKDQYLLITNHPATVLQRGKSYSAAPGGFNNPVLSGSVYAFHSQSGERQWSSPALIEQHGLLLPQPQNTPILAFVRHVSQTEARNRRRTYTSVLCLDKRTGRLVYQNDKISYPTSYFQLETDPQQHTVELQLPRNVVTLKFTNAPTPPEPTYRNREAEPTQKNTSGKGIFGIFSSNEHPFTPREIEAADPFASD